MVVRRYRELLGRRKTWIGSSRGEDRDLQTVQFLSKLNETLYFRKQCLEELGEEPLQTSTHTVDVMQDLRRLPLSEREVSVFFCLSSLILLLLSLWQS